MREREAKEALVEQQRDSAVADEQSPCAEERELLKMEKQWERWLSESEGEEHSCEEKAELGEDIG